MDASHKAAPRFKFQHFNQEYDFGIEDENGDVLRKRKRPGRKPNPPSLPERRAQNRAAQRAFREREQQRRQEKEQEFQRLIDELNYLRRRVSEVQYEANYLRGCVLLLSLASLTERGSVPHIWTDARLFPFPKTYPSPPQIKDDIHTIPAILLTVLGSNHRILEFQKALHAAQSTGWDVTDQVTQVLNNLGNDKSVNATTVTTAAAAAAAAIPAATRTLNDTCGAPSTKNACAQPIPQALSPAHHNVSANQQQQSRNDDNLLPSTGPESMVSTFAAVTPAVGTITEKPALKTPCDLEHMPALQALHILRLQLKCSSILGDKSRSVFTPTALQRLISHDVRIDYIPLGSMRDRMILFQGLYDADDCFELLSTKTMFIGGEERDSRNWIIHPSFSEKYWFLSHHLVDHHSGECGFIPDIIEAIILTQQGEQETVEEPKSGNVTLPSISREGGLKL